MEDKKDIFADSGIPEEFIVFFLGYQRDSKMTKTVWHQEKNGRFAINFRYFILEAMKKNIFESDLMVASALLLAHHESYCSYLLDPKFEESIGRALEIEKMKETTRELAAYMAKHGVEVLCFHSPYFTKTRTILGFGMSDVTPREIRIKLTPERYRHFFCKLPDIWGYEVGQVL